MSTPAEQFPWLKKYPVDVDWHGDIPTSTLVEMFDASVKKFGDRTCLNFMGSKMTYAEVSAAVDTFAANLQKMGYGQGSTIGLCLPNTPYYVIAYYGALKAGARVSNFNPLYADLEIEHQINDSQTDLMVTINVKEILPKVEKMLGKRTCLKKIIACDLSDAMPTGKKIGLRVVQAVKKILALPFLAKNKKIQNSAFKGKIDALPTLVRAKLGKGTVSFSRMVKGVGKPKPVDLQPSDTAVLQYTGGTTGVPKAAELTHANLTSNLTQANIWFNAGGDPNQIDKTLIVLPFFHVFSMTVQMNLTLSRGGELLMLPKFDPKQTLDAIQTERPNMFAGVPSLYQKLLERKDVKDYDFSSLKVCISGGAAMNENVAKGWKELTGINIVEGYGLSETAPIALANPIAGPQKLNSVGLPLPGTHVKLDRSNFTDAEYTDGRGEICIKGPQVMKGYFNKSAETANVMDSEGYFHTGDVGYFDADGYTFIVDRIKDMINVSGFKVFPRKVEDALMSHVAIAEAIVIGVPDESTGEAVKAFIAFTPGARQLSRKEVLDFLKDKITNYEMPKQLEIRDALPKTMIGKPDKKALKKEEEAKRNAPKP